MLDVIVFCIAGVMILALIAFADFVRAKIAGVSVAEIIDRRKSQQKSITDGRRSTDAISV